MFPAQSANAWSFTTDPELLRIGLESMGETHVRLAVEGGEFINNAPMVRAWLAEKEAERRERQARRAQTIAMVSAVAAAISAIASLIGLVASLSRHFGFSGLSL